MGSSSPSLPPPLWAYDFRSGDLYYNITSDTYPYTVEVTYESTWYNYDGLTNATIPSAVTYQGQRYNVTTIGDSTFYNCKNLTAVSIPESVTSIGSYAFYYCLDLTSVTIPESVTSVGEGAFRNCTSLSSATLPAGVTSIENYMFYGCYNLNAITIPNGVTNIGNNAFSNCESLTSVIIPDNVKTIGKYAFSYCQTLTSITIPRSVKSIESNAFQGCNALTKNNYTGDIASWCDIKFDSSNANPMYSSHNLFINDQKIKDVIIPNGVDSIHNYAFYECYDLNSITIPNSVTNIGNDAFYNCCFVKKDFVNNSSLNAEENSYWGALVGESEENGLIINGTTIVGCRKNITSVTIPAYITNIGRYAFHNCSSLTSITIPRSVTSIGSNAFQGCNALTKNNYTGDIASWCDIKFDSSSANPMYSSHNLFINDQEIKDVIIPNSVDSIHDYAFYNGYSLTSVTIPESVTNIGRYAFYNCSSLISITIPQNITRIELSTFGFCSSLTSIIIPNGVTSIGRSAFQGCTSLTSIDIPTSVTNIGYNAFNASGIYNDEANWEDDALYIDNCLITTKDNYDAKEYVIKDGVRLIAGQAFSNLSNIRNIIIPNSVKSISENAFHSRKITSIIIPDSVKNIEENAFCYCTFLNSVKIGNGVTILKNGVFDNCSYLTSINIGEGVKTIEQNAFRSCRSLSSIFLSSSTPPALDFRAFQSASKPVCYIPCNSLAEYQTSTWTDYMDSFVELCDSQMKIFYSSSDSNIVNPYKTDVFNATILDNSYIDNQGVIVFDRPVSQVGDSAFYNCTNLTSIILPNSVTAIDDYAFSYCPSLTSINIPESVITIGNSAFYNCDALTTVAIGNGVTNIGNNAFYDCDALTSVSIGESVMSIENSAFKDCAGLREIILPASLKELGENTFAGCPRIYEITCHAQEPPIAHESSFTNYDAYFHAYCNAQRYYSVDPIWKKFHNVECIVTENTITNNVTITPSDCEATIVWLSNDAAAAYSLVITKNGATFCTLKFNKYGQLTNIAFAPSRTNNQPQRAAEATETGYSFTITGLDANTVYDYQFLIMNDSYETIDEYSGTFTTQNNTPTDIDNLDTLTESAQKLLRNGQLLILREGKTYNAMGTEIK